MYKVGVMMMGKEGSKTPAKVKEVILQVEAKTKIVNVFEYLLELKKIKDMNVTVSLQNGGSKINEASTISQVLKYARPVNGVIKLFLYEIDETLNTSAEKINLKPSRHEIKSQEPVIKKYEQPKEANKKEKQEKSSGFCCC